MTATELLALLEAESTFGDEVNAWIVGTRKALEAIQRVRELHKPYKDTNTYYSKNSELYGVDTWCQECSIEQGMDEYHTPYPCPTIKALDGEQE